MMYYIRKLKLVILIFLFINNKFYKSVEQSLQNSCFKYKNNSQPSIKKILKITGCIFLSNSSVESKNIIEQNLIPMNNIFNNISLNNSNELPFNDFQGLRNLATTSKSNLENNRRLNEFHNFFSDYLNIYNNKYESINELIEDVNSIWDYYPLKKKSDILNYFYGSLKFIEDLNPFFFNINDRLCSKLSDNKCINIKIFPNEFCNNINNVNNFQQLQNYLTANPNCNNNVFFLNSINNLLVNIQNNQKFIFNYKNLLDGKNYFYFINQNINDDYIAFNISNHDQPITVNLNNKIINFNNHYLEVPFVNCKDQNINIVTNNDINIKICNQNQFHNNLINFNINKNNLILLEKLNSMGLSILSGFAVVNNDFRFTFNNEKFISAFLHFYFPVYFTVYEIKNNENFLYTSIELCMDTNTRTIDINKFLKNKKDLSFCYEFHSSNPYFQNIKNVLNNPQKTSCIFIDTQRSLTKNLKIYFYNDFYFIDIQNLLFGQDNTKILDTYAEIPSDGARLLFTDNSTNSTDFKIIFSEAQDIYILNGVQFDVLLYCFNILVGFYLFSVMVNNFFFLFYKQKIYEEFDKDFTTNFTQSQALTYNKTSLKNFHVRRNYMNGYFRNIFMMPVIEMILLSINLNNKSSLLTDSGILVNNILNGILLIIGTINLSTYLLYHKKKDFFINPQLLKELLKSNLKENKEISIQPLEIPRYTPDINEITKFYILLESVLTNQKLNINTRDFFDNKLNTLLSLYNTFEQESEILDIKKNTICYAILIMMFYEAYVNNNQPLINSTFFYNSENTIMANFFNMFNGNMKRIKIQDSPEITSINSSPNNANKDNAVSPTQIFLNKLKDNFFLILEQSQFQGKHVFVNEITLFLFLLINLVLSSNQYAK